MFQGYDYMKTENADMLNANNKEIQRLRLRFPGVSSSSIQKAIIQHGPTRAAVEMELSRIARPDLA
jgi:hypothetical protein